MSGVSRKRPLDTMESDGTPPMKKQYDQATIDKFMEYASDATRARYEKAKSEGKDNIVNNVINKYKPAVDALESSGLFDLIDQLAKCEIEPEPTMDTTQGGRRKKKGGAGEAKTVAVDKLGPLKTALGKTAVEAHAYIFSFENVTKMVPITAIALVNPSTTAIIFNAAKAALGFVGSMCVTNAGITAISLATLACLYDVKFDINSLKFNNDDDKKAILALREQLQKNLKPSSKQFGSVAPTPKSVLDKIAKLQAEEAAKAMAIAKATESEKKALILADKSNEGTLIDTLNTISNEAGVKAESAMPTDAPPSSPMVAPGTTMKAGRNTKKRGLKKMKKTRRGIRKPLFKY